MTVSSNLSTEHVVLIGMMGAGKTTVGRALASRLGREFFDSDAQVESRAGRTVAEIWRDLGEPAFRVLETEALAEALASPTPAVIAAAGGVVLAAENRRLLTGGGRVVWLRVRPETSAGRVASGSHRPLLDHGPAAVLARLAGERQPLYAEVADLVVDVDDIDPEEVVSKIVAAFDGGAR